MRCVRQKRIPLTGPLGHPLPRGERVLDKVLESAIAKPVRRHTLAIADHRPGHRPDITKTSP
ncbi:protein of unknown function [Azospirillum baldaniorum]|uniref:Uncharacterized protein n=1 Tax=Azospirillum baldaniorum TaxID=1064539 RepID=A0A9P1NKM0_9PROT|nr:protein of unknown function [Azospirillum baldaniorum]